MERTLINQTSDLVGRQVLLKGWVNSLRDHGQLIFIDIRDWSGKVQVMVSQKENPSAHQVASRLGKEWVIEIEGKVVERAPELVNPNLKTGKIEVRARSIVIINKSKEIPFPLDTDGTEIDETLRLKYRFLDLRRQRLRDIIEKKHQFLLAVRNWMDKNGFMEVITPLLTTTSPEGARDFLVPSRLYKGKFFVLPQAPQQFKQLLMVSGLDRYFQIAPCARDEDPRADRHAGVFYQIDIEISFPTVDLIFEVAERLLQDTYAILAPKKKLVKIPFPRISYAEAVGRYGSDKPDLRFGLELIDVTSVLKDKSEFEIFNKSKVVKCLVAPNSDHFSESFFERAEQLIKETGASGLIHVRTTQSGIEGGISKFFNEELQSSLVKKVSAKLGETIFLVAGELDQVNKSLGWLRNYLGDALNLKDSDVLSFAWVTDFPFYEINSDGKLDFGHNPFSMPQGGLEAVKTKDPLDIRSLQYDLTLNGFELASGSIRNHEPETLVAVFEKIGYKRDEILRKFGGLYNAFHYGAPPHGGWAIGVDRLMMILLDEENIRDIYAFPLSSSGLDLLMGAPSDVDQKQLDEVGIMLKSEVVKQINQSSQTTKTTDTLFERIKSILSQEKITNQLLEHKPVFTSDQAAKVRGNKPGEGAKALVMLADGKPVMLVVPASRQVDAALFQQLYSIKSLKMATPAEVKKLTGVEIGAVPPFGNLVDLPVYVDAGLAKNKEIVFNAGRHDRSIRMAYADWQQLVQPEIGRFTV